MDTSSRVQSSLPSDREAGHPVVMSPVVMVDGAFGSGMEEVAALLAEKLHVPILDPMRIQEHALEREMQDEAWRHAAEGFMGLVETWVAYLHVRPGLDRSEHRLHIEQLLLEEAREGGVLYGLAPHMNWAGHPLFRVRIEASADHCAHHLAKTRGISLDEAMDLFHRLEGDRHRLVREMLEDFYEGSDSYDLVLSSENASPEELARYTMAAMEKSGITSMVH